MVKVLKKNITDLLMALVGLMIFLLVPYQVGGSRDSLLGAAFFPYLAAIMIMAFSLFPLFVPKRKGKEPVQQAEQAETERISRLTSNYLRLLAVFGCLLFWILLVGDLGFIITTTLATAAMMYLIGCRNRYQLILIPVLFALILYYIFAVLLYVGLPQGIFY